MDGTNNNGLLGVAQGWDRLNAYNVYNVKPAGVAGAIPGLERSAGPGVMTSVPKPWHPDNPLFWVGVLLVLTFAGVAGSTSLRAGPYHAGVNVGTT